MDKIENVQYQPMMRDLPLSDRPRERLLQYGPTVLSNAELLAILIRTGTRGESALAIGQQMLSRFSGLRGIAGATVTELSSQKGVSKVKFAELMAAIELGRRLATASIEDRVIIRSANDVANLLMSDMALLRQEHLRVLLLTTKNHVQAVHSVYIGTVNTSLVRASEVFRPAVRENCPAIILVHNHPSGDPTPSRQDVELTSQLREAGALLNVDLVDHIVIGYEGFVSMKEKGWTNG